MLTKKEMETWQTAITEALGKLEELLTLQADADSYDDLPEKEQDTPKGRLLSAINELDLERMIEDLNSIENQIHDIIDGE